VETKAPAVVVAANLLMAMAAVARSVGDAAGKSVAPSRAPTAGARTREARGGSESASRSARTPRANDGAIKGVEALPELKGVKYI
jgi:hypothetical protein